MLGQLRKKKSSKRPTLSEIPPEQLAAWAEQFGWMSSPIGYATHFEPEFESTAHLELISAAIVAAVMGHGPKRIIITVPPRHAKSTTAVKWGSVWFLDNFPTKRVLFGSYSANFAGSWGKAVRDAIIQHQPELRVRVSRATSARNAWETTKGGYMVSQGVGGSLMGRGADLMLLDDLVKDAASIATKEARDAMHEWYLTSARTRLEPGGVLIMIMTRWHQDDLIGRTIESMKHGGEHFTVINLPALAEEDDPLGRRPGEALWPSRYPVEVLQQTKDSLTEYAWAALYQQRPAPEAGAVFLKAWQPDEVRYNYEDESIWWRTYGRYLSWDTAMADKDDAAFSVMACGELFPNYTMGLKDIRRGRYDFPALVQAVMESIMDYNHDGRLRGVLIEDAASGRPLVQTIKASLPPELARFIVPVTPRGSKVHRARRVAIWVEKGCFLLPRFTPQVSRWLPDFEDEFFNFPSSTYADQVDAVTQLIDAAEQPLAHGYKVRTGVSINMDQLG